MLDHYLQYAKHVNLDAYGIQWVQNVIGKQLEKNALTTEEVEHIIDFLASDAAPKRINKMSFKQAKSGSEKWVKSLIKKGNHIKESLEDTKLILDFEDGFKIVQLMGENAYKREGFLMRHCVASYYEKDLEVYSLRDSNNLPHCTIEKDQQIKGKGNGDIHPKYINYVIKFLEHTGMVVGDSEMQHLGYINIEKFKAELDINTPIINNKYIPENLELKTKTGEVFSSLELLDAKPLIKVTFNSELFINFKNLETFIANSFNYLYNKISKKNKKKTASGDSSQLAASGHYSKLAASGNYSKLELTGNNSVGMCCGLNAYIKAKKDCWITLVEWKEKDDKWIPVNVKSGKIDNITLKEDIWYKLENNEFVECEEN